MLNQNTQPTEPVSTTTSQGECGSFYTKLHQNQTSDYRLSLDNLCENDCFPVNTFIGENNSHFYSRCSRDNTNSVPNKCNYHEQNIAEAGGLNKIKNCLYHPDCQLKFNTVTELFNCDCGEECSNNSQQANNDSEHEIEAHFQDSIDVGVSGVVISIDDSFIQSELLRMIDLKYQNNNQSEGITLEEIDESGNLKILSNDIFFENQVYHYQSLSLEHTLINFLKMTPLFLKATLQIKKSLHL